MKENINDYLIIRSMGKSTISVGFDPVTGDDIEISSGGGITILDSRKTLKGAINLRNKKYKNCLIIPSY